MRGQLNFVPKTSFHCHKWHPGPTRTNKKRHVRVLPPVRIGTIPVIVLVATATDTVAAAAVATTATDTDDESE